MIQARGTCQEESGAALGHRPHQEAELVSTTRDKTILLPLTVSFPLPRTCDFSFIRTPEHDPVCYPERPDQVIPGETKPPAGPPLWSTSCACRQGGEPTAGAAGSGALRLSPRGQALCSRSRPRGDCAPEPARRPAVKEGPLGAPGALDPLGWSGRAHVPKIRLRNLGWFIWRLFFCRMEKRL